jgi:hypothetical protein
LVTRLRTAARTAAREDVLPTTFTRWWATTIAQSRPLETNAGPRGISPTAATSACRALAGNEGVPALAACPGGIPGMPAGPRQSAGLRSVTTALARTEEVSSSGVPWCGATPPYHRRHIPRLGQWGRRGRCAYPGVVSAHARPLRYKGETHSDDNLPFPAPLGATNHPGLDRRGKPLRVHRPERDSAPALVPAVALGPRPPAPTPGVVTDRIRCLRKE